MHTYNSDDLNISLLSYLQHVAKNTQVHPEVRLVDLAFDSIDYLGLSSFLFKKTGTYLDISKINDNTKISDISSYVTKYEQKKRSNNKMVKLDSYQKYVYASQLNDPYHPYSLYILVTLSLKEHIDIPKLNQAIIDTQNNHFSLNSKLVRIIDDYYFENVPPQLDHTFKGSLLFPRKDMAKLLITNIYAERLVNIYIQKKKKRYYLLISFHHVALDGWSLRIIQEEIFRRYAGLFPKSPFTSHKDIPALNQIYETSINEPSDTNELRALLKPIEPYEYGHLHSLFHGKLQVNNSSFILTKKEVDEYAVRNNINNFPYRVIFAFMYHQMISKVSAVNKLIFYTTLSNRHLPIEGIIELVGNLPSAIPLFLNSKNRTSNQFAAEIDKALKIYFKHMSYGALTRILLENDTLLNEFQSPRKQEYVLLYTYINNISKMIYGNDAILSNYINWEQSGTILNLGDRKKITFVIYNLGSEFYIEIRTRMRQDAYHRLVHQFLKLLNKD